MPDDHGELRVLLSDGSGLTARQCVSQLAAAGHEVGVLGAGPLALTRFTRHVRRHHRMPPYGREPMAWMDAALAVLDRERSRGRPVDVLLPTQEQVVVLARRAGEVRARGVRLAVPAAPALDRVFDKVSAVTTLDVLGLPQPGTVVVRDRRRLLRHAEFPVFVKTPVGTAGTGVRLARGAADLARLAGPPGADPFPDGLVLQRPVRGPLLMVQGVFDAGRLVAWHASRRTRDGVNGGAAGKRGEPLPVAGDYLGTLGRELRWHGALSFDLIVPDGGPPVIIDVNPRLVEPGNAWRSGTDLVAAMLAVSTGDHPAPCPPGRPGVRTHQLLLAVLAAAPGGRRAVLRELADAVRHRGPYAGSTEELTPAAGDPRAAVPILAATLAAMLGPRAAGALATGAVESYALTVEGWRHLRSAGGG